MWNSEVKTQMIKQDNAVPQLVLIVLVITIHAVDCHYEQPAQLEIYREIHTDDGAAGMTMPGD